MACIEEFLGKPAADMTGVGRGSYASVVKVPPVLV